MKTILIAGAGKGIGLRTAELLSEQYKLITLSKSASEALDRLNTQFHQVDVANDSLDGMDNMPGELHGLVYCPGSINLKPFHRLKPEDFLEDYRQNVVGAVTLIQKVLPQLKQAGGASIVLFSTVAAKVGMPFHASVAAAKSAVEGLTKSLAAELAGSNIRVNAIAPSLTDTSLAASLLSTPEKREAAARRHPLQRVGTTDDMAQLAAFLLGPQSSWITGQVIGVDGGLGSVRV